MGIDDEEGVVGGVGWLVGWGGLGSYSEKCKLAA